MLRVIPQGGDGVAVEVAHHRVPLAGLRLVAELARVERRLGVEADELVHQAAVARLLLGGVLVVLVAGVGLAAVDPEWPGGVRVSLDQRRIEAVDRGRALPRVKNGLARQIEGFRIGPEVDVERVVLLEDHHQVLDRGVRCGTPAGRLGAGSGGNKQNAESQRDPDPTSDFWSVQHGERIHDNVRGWHGPTQG